MQLSITDNLEIIEREWRCFEESAECTPFQTFDWLSTWQRCVGSPAGVKPAIVIGRQGSGELLFILPLAIERTRLGRRCVFLGRALCDYNAPLLAPEFSSVIAPGEFAEWWRTIEAFIQKTPGYNYEVRLFDKMPERIGEQANPMLALAITLNSSRAYRANLGEDWECFYASRRSATTRSRDRTKRRRLAEKGELRLVIADTPEERQSVLKTLFHQKSRWLAQKEPTGLPKHGFDNIFTQPDHSNFYLSVANNADSLVQVSRLDVGSISVATNFGLRFRGCYYYILASYDDGPLGKLGPGVIQLHELMYHAISQGLRRFDFTIGDHPYKLDWADEHINLYDHIASAGWLGLPAAAQITLTPRAKRLLKKSPRLWRLARQCKSVVSSIFRESSA